MKISDQLWQKINPIYQDILAHPFNVELSQGTLAKEKFLFYLEQDALFLIDFARALAIIAARFQDEKKIDFFLNVALSSLNAERELHEKFQAQGTYKTAACLNYTRFLMTTVATASLEEAIACVTPCFWIYRQVGSHMSERMSNNPYSEWIATYSSQHFSETTDRLLCILNEIATPAYFSKVSNAFEEAASFEWHFWNDVYNFQHAILFCR